MIFSLTLSLLLTIVFETFTSIMLGIRNKEDLTVVFFANVLTNPIVVFLANTSQLLNNKIFEYVVIGVLELLALVVEYIIFKYFLDYKKKSPLLISCVNNSISFLSGIILSNIIF